MSLESIVPQITLKIRHPHSYPTTDLNWWRSYFGYIHDIDIDSASYIAKSIFNILKSDQREMIDYLKWISDPSYTPSSIDVIICRMINETS